MVILPGIRVIVRRFLCIERRFLSDWSKKFYVDVLSQCGLGTWFIGGFVRDREAFEESVAAMWTVLIVTAKYGRIKCQSDRHTLIHSPYSV